MSITVALCLPPNPEHRWNLTLADQYDLHLNFLAILTGFLTYKVAVFAKQSKSVADEISAQGRQQQQRGSG